MVTPLTAGLAMLAGAVFLSRKRGTLSAFITKTSEPEDLAKEFILRATRFDARYGSFEKGMHDEEYEALESVVGWTGDEDPTKEEWEKAHQFVLCKHGTLQYLDEALDVLDSIRDVTNHPRWGETYNQFHNKDLVYDKDYFPMSIADSLDAFNETTRFVRSLEREAKTVCGWRRRPSP